MYKRQIYPYQKAHPARYGSGGIMALRQHYWNPRTNEACFVDETQLIYAFNERQDAGTWSDLHVHPDWGELLFVATGSIVLCSETGNFLGQGYRATWVPPGVQHEWYLPEASWNRSLFFLSLIHIFQAYRKGAVPAWKPP